MSDTTNSWIIFDDLLCEIAIDIKVWKDKFINYKKNNSKMLLGVNIF